MSDFWELHRRLGECYDADMGRGKPGKGAFQRSSSFHRQVSGKGGSPRRIAPQGPFEKAAPPDAPPAMMAHTNSVGSQNAEEDFLSVMGSPVSNTPRLQEMRALSGALQGHASQAAAASVASDAEGPLPFVAIPHACWRKKAKRNPSHARSRANVSVASNLLQTFSGVEKNPVMSGESFG